MHRTDHIDWVILTMGDRPEQLQDAVQSLRAGAPAGSDVVVVVNGPDDVDVPGARTFVMGDNLGVPGGRDRGVALTSAPIVGFLDDDAIASPAVSDAVVQAFASDGCIGAVALHLHDEEGQTARRHVPRFGGRRPDESGDVALFLGGACAIRREAYRAAGGYWSALHYGHEEVELCWRLVDAGWRISYLADVTVEHPRTEIARHADGWRLTGRNRVMIARRTLPWPVALVHVGAWLVLGVVRAPGRPLRRAYWDGWQSGWRMPVERAPIGWRAVWRLVRLGRPPIL